MKIHKGIFVLSFMLFLMGCGTSSPLKKNQEAVFLIHFTRASQMSTVSGSYTFSFKIDDVIRRGSFEAPISGAISTQAGSVATILSREIVHDDWMSSRDGLHAEGVIRDEGKQYRLSIKSFDDFVLTAISDSFELVRKDHAIPTFLTIQND